MQHVRNMVESVEGGICCARKVCGVLSLSEVERVLIGQDGICMERKDVACQIVDFACKLLLKQSDGQCAIHAYHRFHYFLFFLVFLLKHQNVF